MSAASTPRAGTTALLFLMALVSAGVGLASAHLPALRTLRHFATAGVGEDGEAPAGFRMLEDEAAYGFRRVWLAPATQGPTRAPTLLFLHGVAEKGLEDARILHALEAFRQAGLTVVAPEIPFLVSPPESDQDEARLDRLLDALLGGRMREVDPERVGVMGVSVAGALAIRGVIRVQERAAGRVKALLALGTPADLDRIGADWFAMPRPTRPKGESADDLAEMRRHEAVFARNIVFRAALPARVSEASDRSVIRSWLEATESPEAPPDEELGEAGRAYVRLVLANAETHAAAGPHLMADAAPRLAPLRIPREAGRLRSLAGTPAWLLFGAGDPLVPPTELEALERHLAPFTTCHTLASRMLGHVDVAGAGLGEGLAHVRFFERFYTAIRGH